MQDEIGQGNSIERWVSGPPGFPVKANRQLDQIEQLVVKAPRQVDRPGRGASSTFVAIDNMYGKPSMAHAANTETGTHLVLALCDKDGVLLGVEEWVDDEPFTYNPRFVALRTSSGRAVTLSFDANTVFRTPPVGRWLSDNNAAGRFYRHEDVDPIPALTGLAGMTCLFVEDEQTAAIVGDDIWIDVVDGEEEEEGTRRVEHIGPGETDATIDPVATFAAVDDAGTAKIRLESKPAEYDATGHRSGTAADAAKDVAVSGDAWIQPAASGGALSITHIGPAAQATAIDSIAGFSVGSGNLSLTSVLTGFDAKGHGRGLADTQVRTVPLANLIDVDAINNLIQAAINAKLEELGPLVKSVECGDGTLVVEYTGQEPPPE